MLFTNNPSVGFLRQLFYAMHGATAREVDIIRTLSL